MKPGTVPCTATAIPELGDSAAIPRTWGELGYLGGLGTRTITLCSIVATLGALTTAVWAQQEANPCDPTAASQCAHPSFEYTFFSPDSRHLYFTYQYHALSATRAFSYPISGRVLARLEIASNDIQQLKADCRFDYGNPAVSPDGKYLLYSVDTRRRHPGPEDQYLELVDTVTHTTQKIRVTEYHSKEYFAPFFSSDSRYLYFARASSYHSVLLFSYDISSQALDLIFPKFLDRRMLPNTEGESTKRFHATFDSLGTIRTMARPGFLGTGNEVVFYGSLPSVVAAEKLLSNLSSPTGLSARMLRMRRLIYTIDLNTKALNLHPASSTLDMQKMGVGAFRVVPGEGIFLLNGYYKFPTVDRTVYRYDASSRSLTKFDQLGQDNYQWFDISPDLRWIAYTYDHYRTVAPANVPPKQELVLKDRQTSRERAINLRRPVSYLSAAQLCDSQ